MKLAARRRLAALGVLAPPLLWTVLLMFVPYAIMFAYSFYRKQFPVFIPDFQLGNYLLLVSDPQYTNRDALYFHLAESLYLQGKQSTVDSESQAKFAEALPYYERLVTEFEKSEYLAGAQKRISELKNPS